MAEQMIEQCATDARADVLRIDPQVFELAGGPVARQRIEADHLRVLHGAVRVVVDDEFRRDRQLLGPELDQFLGVAPEALRRMSDPRQLATIGSARSADSERVGRHGESLPPCGFWFEVSPSRSDASGVAASRSAPATRTVIHTTVSARRFPCQSPLNQSVISPATTLAFPPYRSRSRRYRLESSGSYPNGFPGAAPAVRYIQIALANPTIEVTAAARRRTPCDVVGRHRIPGGDPPDHSCQAGHRTARAVSTRVLPSPGHPR